MNAVLHVRPITSSRLSGTSTIAVPVETALRTPVTSELSDGVQLLLRRGERRIVLDLSRLADIDAAGAGELVRVLNAVRAVGGSLEIEHATRRVRQFLDRAGILGLLAADSAA